MEISIKATDNANSKHSLQVELPVTWHPETRMYRAQQKNSKLWSAGNKPTEAIGNWIQQHGQKFIIVKIEH
jgi:hypothetical protein